MDIDALNDKVKKLNLKKGDLIKVAKERSGGISFIGRIERIEYLEQPRSWGIKVHNIDWTIRTRSIRTYDQIIYDIGRITLDEIIFHYNLVLGNLSTALSNAKGFTDSIRKF